MLLEWRQCIIWVGWSDLAGSVAAQFTSLCQGVKLKLSSNLEVSETLCSRQKWSLKMRKFSPHLKQVRQCDPDLSVFKRVIKGSEEKSCTLLEPELNIYVSSRNWINHSSAASLPTQLGVLWWKQTGLSSDSALDWYTPGFPEKTKHDGVLWEQRVAGGSWHAFLKRLRQWEPAVGPVKARRSESSWHFHHQHDRFVA